MFTNLFSRSPFLSHCHYSFVFVRIEQVVNLTYLHFLRKYHRNNCFAIDHYCYTLPTILCCRKGWGRYIVWYQEGMTALVPFKNFHGRQMRKNTVFTRSPLFGHAIQWSFFGSYCMEPFIGQQEVRLASTRRFISSSATQRMSSPVNITHRQHPSIHRFFHRDALYSQAWGENHICSREHFLAVFLYK